ncbi:hypothetical protein [Priestia aryabhattai]|uniref:hypothetical protein n=1 Tax=Priestia aryabhattai TaxID=412384 RepID=UPI001873FA66|nr:hypothetical protein [Priestia aryabhattai]MBE5102224.1 hypothetical protein [Priestia aryabhattai]
MLNNMMKHLFKFFNDDETLVGFGTRSLWYNIGINPDVAKERFINYLGEEQRKIRTRDEAIEILDVLIKEIQSKMRDRMKKTDSRVFIAQLQNIFAKVYKVYIEQKEIRSKLKDMNIRDGAAIEIYDVNRQISKCLLDGISIWIENALLYENISDNEYEKVDKIDNELLIDTYIYGVASMNFSLLHMSKLKRFDEKEFFYGLDITPNEDIPLEAYRDHPVIYHNSIITGNQEHLYQDQEFKYADSMEIGISFKEKYGISFLSYMAILYGLPHYGVKEYMSKIEFTSLIDNLGIDGVNSELVYTNLTLKRSEVATHLKNDDEYIWTVETNEHRISLKPFIQLKSGYIMTNIQLLERAMNTWVSYLLNGGSVYVKNPADTLLKAFQSRNEQLGNRLVELLRDTLRANYKGTTFDEIEVPYSTIWGKREINYGDFDLMFYSKETNELFLIESKYICDSLNSSSIVSDYDKIFRDKGYHFKCRRRYDLVLNEPDPIKKHIGVQGEINVHFLFITSKPLEIELQDKDDIVTFVSLEMFDSYINGRYESEDGEKTIRPTYKI